MCAHYKNMQFLTAFVLGLLTILDPCTLFTSITAIGYIDKEISDKHKVLTNGVMFVMGNCAPMSYWAFRSCLVHKPMVFSML